MKTLLTFLLQLQAALWFTSDMARAAQCPDPRCTCTKTAISCIGIKLQAVPVFTNVDNYVQFLVLDNNEITNIPREAFAKLPQLTTVSIKENPLSTIDSAAFAASKEINHLMLSRPQGTEPTATINVTNIVSQLPKLSELEITRMKVNTLDANFVYNSVTKLTLDTCAISSIDNSAFQSASALKQLSLPNNKWGASPNTSLLLWLRPLISVTYLDFSKCGLSNVLSPLPSSLNNLQTLILSSNQLKMINDDSLKNVKSSLQILDVSFNENLEDIQTVLPFLQQLNLDSNKVIKILPKTLVNMNSLSKLKLDYTYITSLGTDTLPASLTELSLIGCIKLNYIDTHTFAKTPKLAHLFIEEVDFNQIKVDWQGLLQYTSQLTTLYLAPSFEAKTVPNIFIWDVIQPMTRLEDLNLMNNQVGLVPDFVFRNLKKLRILNLANNNLTRITSATFFGPQALLELNLEDNKLSTFDNCSFAYFNSTSVQLKLKGNPLRCVCAMRWLRVQWTKNLVMFDTLNCANESVTWAQKSENQFCTSQEAAKLPTCAIQPPPVEQPIYNIQVTATLLAQNQVRVEINMSQQLQKVFVNWFVEYGVQDSATRFRSDPSSRMTAYIVVNITSDITQRVSVAPLIFCPALTLLNYDTYRHPSYCRQLLIVGPTSSLSAAMLGGVIAGVLSILVIIVVLAVLCALRRVRRRARRKENESGQSNVTEEEEDPYAYAVPETLFNNNKRETSSVTPRQRTTSRTFSRAKSHEEHLNSNNSTPRHSNGSTTTSSKVPSHHRSTPHMVKGQSNPSGQANSAFVSSVVSLHHNSNIGSRISAVSAKGYPLAHPQEQSRSRRALHVNSQPLPPRTGQREMLSRSVDHLSAERSLPPAPPDQHRRIVHSTEIMLDPRQAQRNYKEQPYEQMTDNRRRSELFSNNNDAFISIENSYGPSPSIEFVQTRSPGVPSNSQSTTDDIENSYFEMGRF